jgi:hypothetical protein
MLLSALHNLGRKQALLSTFRWQTTPFTTTARGTRPPAIEGGTMPGA